MIRRIVIGSMVVICFLLPFSNSFATSPAEIELTPDMEKQILHIKVDHVSHNVKKHYIRVMEIFKNDELLDTFYFAVQPLASGVIKDVAMPLKTGDKIKVRAVCKLAGEKEATLIIP